MNRLTGRQLLEAIEVLRDNKDKYNEFEYWQIYFIFRKEFYNSAAWILLSKEVREETPFCERCFRDNRILHAHHIKRLYTHTYLGLEKSNLEVLCILCHRKEHRKVA